MRGVGDMLLFRDREMGKAVTGFESRTVTAHEVSNNNIFMGHFFDFYNIERVKQKREKVW